jgi:catechol 2,3-dioxygenase-like lactoylglutathione lyase family enzyme/GNAT superfamily N-acetyltransferase
MSLRGINHVTFATSDVARSVRFYVDVLGCRVAAQWPDGAYLVAGDLWLALVRGSDERRPPDDYSHVAFDAGPEALAEIRERAEAAGVETRQENWTEGDSIYLLDPAGRRIEVHCTDLVERLRDASEHPWDGLVIAPGATVRFEVVDPRSTEALTAMTAYFGELDERFSDGFDPADTLVADAPSMRAPHGGFVVARSDDAVVACGGVARHDEVTGEIKRMWVAPAWRGVGLGRRMLDQLEEHVAGLGYTRVVLDTNAVLTEAVAMYESAGYAPIERYNDNPYAHHWFEKRLRP